MDYSQKKMAQSLERDDAGEFCTNVIFQCYEHHILNELHYYVVETESPVRTNLFAWLDTTCGVKNIYF